MSGQTRETQRDILLAVSRRKLPMPRTPRELFQLLEHLTPERDLDGVVDLIDFAGATPGDICLAVFGRGPGNLENAIPLPAFDPSAFFKETVLSAEFRRSIMPAFLKAYPEKARDVFIHVPKCAGTDLIINLGSRLLPLPKLLEIPGWLSDREFLLTVGGIARLANHHDRIFVHGHMELGEYIHDTGIRSSDRIFTVIRDPLDQMLSQANYAIGRLRQDPLGTAHDTAEILQYLGIPRLPENIGNRDLKDLATRALLHPEITQPNRACTYLGRGMAGTYASAIDRLVVHDVEITTTKQYDRWLRERWNIGASEHHNRSEPVLRRNEVQWLYADALRSSVAEDQKLFDVVSWALEQTGGASVTGLEIGRLGRAWLPNGLPPGLAATAQPAAALSAKPNLLAAEEPQAVDLHLQTARAASPDAPQTQNLMTIDFGASGTGRDYQLDGWSVTETTFTWTNAASARLELPPLPPGDLCVLQLIGNPYVSEAALPFQRIEVWVNDECLGEAQVKDIAVIECEIPHRLLREHEPFVVTLRLPTAARPMDTSGIEDDRLLAFALHRIVVMAVRAPGV